MVSDTSIDKIRLKVDGKYYKVIERIPFVSDRPKTIKSLEKQLLNIRKKTIAQYGADITKISKEALLFPCLAGGDKHEDIMAAKGFTLAIINNTVHFQNGIYDATYEGKFIKNITKSGVKIFERKNPDHELMEDIDKDDELIELIVQDKPIPRRYYAG
jgi:hypothetical protein